LKCGIYGEREKALLRAQDVSEQLDDSARLIEVLLGLAVLHGTRGDYSTAYELAQTGERMSRAMRARLSFLIESMRGGARSWRHLIPSIDSSPLIKILENSSILTP
jgi:hypothetical protein